MYASPVLEARSISILLEISLSGRLSRSRRMRCRVGYYILCTSRSGGLQRGSDMSLNICF